MIGWTSPKAQLHDSICVLSMADAFAEKAYAASLQSHRNYAKRHNLTYMMQVLGRKDSAYPITYNKLDIVEKWLHNASCAWIVWFDADVYITNPKLPLRRWVHPSNELILTDHHAALNNGAFFMRNSNFMATKFMKAWREAAYSRPFYPFTDNGSMIEAILQLFVPKYKSWSCPRMEILRCAHSHFDEAYGPIKPIGPFKPIGPTTHARSRGTNGLSLIHPMNGFNNHGCLGATGEVVDCHTINFDKTEAAGYGWHIDDMYNPTLNMFALHTKDVHTLQKRTLIQTLVPMTNP